MSYYPVKYEPTKKRNLQLETTIKIEKSLFLGLDLGLQKDYSALAIVECVRTSKTVDLVGIRADCTNTTDTIDRLSCVHLKRWALKTSYAAIVANVIKMLDNLDPDASHTRRPVLCVDTTATGGPVLDLFRREAIKAELVAFQITGGANVTTEFGMVRIPKRDLLSAVQVALQDRKLKIAAQLPDAELLSRELQNFTVKITNSANDVYGNWREGTHDDLVFAVSLAVWKASQKIDRGLPERRSVHYRNHSL
jgi:hypothetical protein